VRSAHTNTHTQHTHHKHAHTPNSHKLIKFIIMLARYVILLLAAVLASCLLSSQQVAATANSMIPLSSTSFSFPRGSLSTVVVDLYIDLACSETQSVWSQLKDVVKTFEHDVLFNFHLFPLPYHQQAFILSKAAHVVGYNVGLESVFTFFDTCFALQDKIYNDATADMTYNQVVNLVGTWAVNGTGLTWDQYAEGMNKQTTVGQNLEMQARYMWKYSALHDVFGTPLYYIGGVFVVEGLETYDDWVEALTPLVTASKGK
jgi:hypothetical protein